MPSMFSRSQKRLLPLVVVAFGALTVATADAGAPGAGTATIAVDPATMQAPGTLQATASFAVTTPFNPPVGTTYSVSLYLSGTDGAVTLGTPVASDGLINCDFDFPNRSYRCEIADPTVLGSYSLTATVSANQVPVLGAVDVFARLTWDALNGPIPVVTDTTSVAVTAAPATTTTAPATTTTDLASGGTSLPGVGSASTPVAGLAAVLVAAGGLLMALRRRAPRPH